MANALALKFEKRTDPGKKRSDNQDYLFSDLELRAFVVCDGAGGHEGGQMAAKLAAEKTVEFIKSAIKSFKRPESRREALSAYEEIVRNAIRNASAIVSEEAKAQGFSGGSYSTLDLLWFVDGSTVIVGHIGDGSIYRRNGNSISLLTTDHNLGTELNGLKTQGDLIYTREQIRSNANLRPLSRAIGSNACNADVFRHPLSEGDNFIVCTDGLADEVRPDDMLSVLVKSSTPEAAAEALLMRARTGAAKDNISFYVILCEPVLPKEERTQAFAPDFVTSALKSSRLFEGLTSQELETFAGKGQRKTVKAGDFLVSQGDLATTFWIILDGKVDVLADGNRVDTHAAPTLIGEAALSKAPRNRTATVRAATDVRAVVIETADFMEYCRHFPQAALQILLSTNLILLEKTENLSKKLSEMQVTKETRNR